MRKTNRRLIKGAAILLLLLSLVTTAFAAGEDPTELSGTKYVECPDCATLGVVLSEEGEAVPCETCADSGFVGYITSSSGFFNTPLSR